MSKVYAHRDLKICTKDCLCLFVCPTGATNNETGQIDKEKCIGCGACASACPAHAITLLPRKMPPAQQKTKAVCASLKQVIKNKVKEMRMLDYMLKKAESETEKKFLKALKQSNQVLLEDFMRESGYMLPESKNTRDFLENIKEEASINKEATILLEKLEVND